MEILIMVTPCHWAPVKVGRCFLHTTLFLALIPEVYRINMPAIGNKMLINRSLIEGHCAENPKKWVSYSETSWGLTASDNPWGYSAHSPSNDLGVITPTAAVSALPYTPEESMEAIRYFYFILGDRLWGEYGFYDAFDVNENWWATSYIAIDQGPIVCMIENHRTGLLWDLFMSAPEVQNGLTELGFSY